MPADIVVSCGGFWGPELGALDRDGRSAAAHWPTSTSRPIRSPNSSGATPRSSEAGFPILRHQDQDLYFREHVDRLGIGSYAHRPMPVDLRELPVRRDHRGRDALDARVHRRRLRPGVGADARSCCRACETATIDIGFQRHLLLHPGRRTADRRIPDVAGFWIAEAVWVTHSAGVARAVAQLLVDGRSEVALHGCDVHRFEEVQLDPGYVSETSQQNFVEVYDILHPVAAQGISAQPAGQPVPRRGRRNSGRCSSRAAAGSGRTGSTPTPALVDRAAHRVAAARPRRLGRRCSTRPIAAAEAWRTRTAVALYDMTPLKRLEISGPGALALLERLTTGKMDKSVGSVTYTLALDAAGGVRSDITVARLSAEHLPGRRERQPGSRLLPPTGALRRKRRGPRHHRRNMLHRRVGSARPRPRDALSRDDFSNESFKYFRSKQVRIGGVPVTAMRLSYVGELGWELYTTAEHGLRLWDALWAEGQRHGVIAAGRAAFNSLRMEKGYRSWGTDMTTEHNPYEAGLGFAVRPQKEASSGATRSRASPTTPSNAGWPA